MVISERAELSSHQVKRYSQKVVLLAGGTGLSNALRGFKKLNDPSKLMAIPSGWDDGGSTGRLRDETGALPPGDFRQCIISAMDDGQRVIAQKLLDDRLADIDGPFKGHSFGNLLVARLENIYRDPNLMSDSIRALFRIQAKIYLPSMVELRLIAKLRSAIEIEGETNIDNRRFRDDFKPDDRIARIYFNTQPIPNLKVLRAIKRADKIVLGPGDLYTSVLPHGLIEETRLAVQQSQAAQFFVLNLMSKPGETDNYKASDHLAAYFDIFGNPSEFFKDRPFYLIASRNNIDQKVLQIYHNEGQEEIEVDNDRCYQVAGDLGVRNFRLIVTPLAMYHKQVHLLRHDSEALARLILSL